MIKYEIETRTASPFPSVRVHRVIDDVKEREPIVIFPAGDADEAQQAKKLAAAFLMLMESGYLEPVRKALGIA